MRAVDKLRANWSKQENDVMLHWPSGICTKADGHWLSGVFDKAFIKELEKRGYDPQTMRFSVEPKRGNERFTSQKTSKQQ
jgi:hypothetical protein